MDSSLIEDRELACYISWLGPTELQRYQRFVRPERQRQFLLGRILLRQSLSQLLDVPVSALQLTECPGNAPQLDFPVCPDLGFSLSHSGNWVACALSASTRLGLDIELLNPDRDFSALALHAFDAAENAWLQQQDAGNRMHDFYRLWTSREAHIKLNAKLNAELNVENAECLHFPHPELSITLCSAEQLTSSPQLLHIDLLSAE
ncbi:4'-phosphopantetheinyl transferase superfamily protein [Undibacterium sp. CY18W]|uniref:4'-phosphopantetheinyl transferase superfamily protein n=1 Tax=Undibacterium hunanense TaxID=2762292 RepID=A0ABR6ZVF3_9BURK|nr:4'-phosphopantetheinyl transferase superfamily protein [Undibacterium hunanense]MBC3919843.1 4'-phosphopantetheinyl transferase superfamily protein [Undibacterium hunanense]